MSKKMQIFVLMGTIAILFTVIAITYIGNDKDENTLCVGFVMSGGIDDEGWNGEHYDGVKAACEELNVELIVKEHIEEYKGQCKKAVKELIKEKANVIILSSYNYSEEMKDMVKKYPDVSFYCNSSEYHDKNMTSYFVRYYQGRYLAGILAGLQTKTDKIGYVAAMANNEVNRGINAFTLGVRSVNKEADVLVSWTGSWDDEKKEKELTNKLIEKKDADVIAYHQNQSYVVEAADKKGVYSIGYHEYYKGFSDSYLTSVICNWNHVYKEMLKECLQGRANSEENLWIGIEKDVIELSKYSGKVSKEAKDKIEDARKKIIGGVHVFAGVIYDNEGKKRCDKNEIISDEILLKHMNWYVEGVEFYE